MTKKELMETIKKIINKPGEKVNYRGYSICKEDEKIFNYYLTLENLCENEQLLRDNTEKFIITLKERLSVINQHVTEDLLSERKAIVILLDLFSNVKKLVVNGKIDQICYYHNLLVPRENYDLFVSCFSELLIPENELNKENVQNVINSIEVMQRRRIHDSMKEDKVTIDNIDYLLDDLDVSQKNVDKVKNDAKSFISVNMPEQPLNHEERKANFKDILIQTNNVLEEIQKQKKAGKFMSVSSDELNEYMEKLNYQIILAKARGNLTASMYYEGLYEMAKSNGIINREISDILNGDNKISL